MTYLKAPFEQDNPRGYHFQVWKKEATPPDRQFLIRGFETSLSPSNFSKILNFGKVNCLWYPFLFISPAKTAILQTEPEN